MDIYLSLISNTRVISKLSLAVFLLSFSVSQAVGIKDIDPNNDQIALSFAKTSAGMYNNFMRYNSDEDERLYVSMKTGENLLFGLQCEVGNFNNYITQAGNVWVKIRRGSDNSLVFGPTEIALGQNGYINNLGEATAGPSTIAGAGGYNALSFLAPSDDDYYIEIGYSTTNGVIDDFNALGNDYFLAPLYDFTVIDPNNANKIEKGRVWSKAWHIFVKTGFVGELQSQQYIYTDDGIISKLDYNGISPYQYILISNGFGAQNTGNFIDDRKSINSTLGDELVPQYKLFFDVPDTTIFQLADLNLLFGDLNQPIYMTGCAGDYCINIDVNRKSVAKLLMDLDGVVGYQAGTEDVLMEVELDAGNNCVFWEGKDGLGNEITTADISIDIEFIAGVTHLPMFDVEFNQNGLVVDFLYPASIAGRADIYWDDVNTGGSVNDLVGCTNSCHIWGNSYGDVKIINSWWYVSKSPITSAVTINPFSIDAGVDVALCPEDSSLANPTTGIANYSWSPAIMVSDPLAEKPYVYGTSSGYLTLTATTAAGCVFKDSLFVTGYAKPQLLTADQMMCPEGSTNLTVTGAATYQWDNGLGAGNSHSVDPTNTTTYQVIGTDNNGCLDTAVATVTVLNSPTILASSGAMCPEGKAVLIASGGVSYEWDNNIGTGNNIEVSPNTTTTFTVIGKDVNGCVNTTTTTVTLYNSPTVTAASPMMCRENSTILTASGAVSYVWDNGVGAGNGLVVSPNQPTTYKVVGTDSNGCKDSTTTTVTFYSSPTVTAVAPMMCKENSTTLTASGAVSYEWNQGIGAGNGLVVSPNQPTTYQVIGTDNNGCVDSAEVTVNFYPTPVLTVTSDRICTGEEGVLTVTGAQTYIWSNSSTSGVLKDSPVVTTNYTVEGKDVNGCIGQSSGIIEVLPQPVLTLVSSSYEVCKGEEIEITGAGVDEIDWGNGFKQKNTQTFSPLQSTEYTVIGKISGCRDTAKVMIDVNDLPEIKANDATVCIGESALLHASGGVTYEWDGLGQGNDFIVFPDYTTIYEVEGIDNNGCVGYAEIEVFVNQLPDVEGYIPDDKILRGEQMVMTPVTDASTIKLEELPSGYLVYEGQTQTVYLVPDSSSNYLLTGLLNNCPDSTNLDVEVVDLIIVPNMITPNGDGLNDYWIIDHIADFPEAEVTLYNRWGNVVLRQTAYDDSFEGTFNAEDLPAAVYYYVIKLNFRDYIYKGSLTIMR